MTTRLPPNAIATASGKLTATAGTAAATEIKQATKDDEEHVVGTLVLAFSQDPVVRWIYARPHDYLAHWPAFVKAFCGEPFEQGTAYYAGAYAGAALWLPPGASADEEALASLIQVTVPDHVRQDLFGLLEEMAGYHPAEPHWYLPMIGVDPAMQHRGLGSSLLKHSLAVCDREGRAAYLESSHPANVPLYERHGFEVLATLQVGGSPAVWPMIRKPR